MAFTLDHVEVFRVSDATDANGRRIITYEQRELYVQVSPPDSYWTIPATCRWQLINGGNTSGPVAQMRPVQELTPRSGTYTVNNPVPVVCVSQGGCDNQFPDCSVPASGIWHEEVDAHAPFGDVNQYDSGISALAGAYTFQKYAFYSTYMDGGNTSPPQLYPPNIESDAEIIQPVVTLISNTVLYAPNLEARSELVPPLLARIDTPPTVTNFVPAANTSILPTSVLQFDVTDLNDDLSRILLAVEFPNAQIREVMFDGAGFGPRYQNASNTAVPITNGWRFNVLRDGGWFVNDGPVITPFALDLEGLENA